ncbi:MAG: SpoIIE family protein phosphatase [Chloroflexi bacterium]|nr:SpoIIE family protein phosphatase [Chloroflexota bacterium]MCL5105028.1 SpoIIE family protein phosphatase [Armatimonadota bacterium]
MDEDVVTKLTLGNVPAAVPRRHAPEVEPDTDLYTGILEAVSESTEACLAYLDRDFNFVWVNSAYAHGACRTREEFTGHNHFEYYPHKENEAIFRQVRDTGAPFAVRAKPFEFPDHPERGVTYWDWTLTPVKDGEGETQGLVLSLIDVTERVEFEMHCQEIYEREHHIAEVLQQALKPPQIPEIVSGYRIAAKYQPALHEASVGGDFYDVFELRGGKIGILIGDIAGKGLSAAIRVAMARYAIRSYAYLDPSPGKVLALANAALCRELGEITNMLTAFLAVVDTREGTVTCASGGHEPPLVLRACGTVEELAVFGGAMGVVEDSDYHESILSLAAGEVVVMVTDGITEARKDKKLLGKEALVQHLVRLNGSSPAEIAEALLQAAKTYTGGDLQDDAAIVVFGPEYRVPPLPRGD